MIEKWEELSVRFSKEGYPKELKTLKPEEGQFLLDQLKKLDALKELQGLFALEEEQEQLGAGFYGILNSPLPEIKEIELKETEEDFKKAVFLLAKCRENAREQIKEKMPYSLNFKGEKPSLPDDKHCFPGRINLKTEGLKKLLVCMGNGDLEELQVLVENEAFIEMFKHRKNLGYLPDPIIDPNGLKKMFSRGLSRDPLCEIWKWINPQNFFDTADFYLNQNAYRETILTLENNWRGFEGIILGIIYDFAPKGFVFNDNFSLSLGWGIRGWATEKTAGLNLEHVKDDFLGIISCALHELFHRFQLEVCPRGEGKGFEALLVSPKKLEHSDGLLYKTLSYIFLEGTAEYACNLLKDYREPKMEDIEKGLALLEEIFSQIGEKTDEEIDQLINQGLISNGPFYSLGKYICSKLKENGQQQFKEAFLGGSPAFFNHFFASNKRLKVSPALLKKIDEIS